MNVDLAQAGGSVNRKRTISIVVAIVCAIGLALFYWSEQRNWLTEITLEVQASSAPGMAMSHPTRGAISLKTADGNEQTIQAKVWAGPTGKVFSALRFDFPLASYDKATFFPDPSLREIEMTGVRIIPHDDQKVIDLPLDAVQSEQSFVTTNRARDSVAFARPGGNEFLAIDIQIAEALKQINSAGSKPYLATALLFLFALVAFYSCAIRVSSNAFRFVRSTSNTAPAQRPFVRVGIILGLVAWMAAAAPENSHPDEYLHVEAARYYIHHWLPPSIDSEWVTPSFSHYGLTYLTGIDIGYFFAGKFAFFLQPLFQDTYTALRFFNVALFVVLLWWSMRTFEESLATSLFFLTPQLWYVFSGYNTDGWALFVSFMLIGQIVSRDSSLQLYLRSTDFRSISLLLPALCWSCLLLLSKVNFFFVALFFAMWLLWQLRLPELGVSIVTRTLKILPLILLPLILRFGVQSYQSAVNKGDLHHAIVQQAEKFADPNFKPSVLKTPGQGFEGVNMRARGYSLFETLIDQHWLHRTVASFCGAYGWMAFFARPWFYFLMALGWLVFIGCVLRATFKHLVGPDRVFCGIAWLFLPLIMIVALYYSWTYDFQAQGRYLFPFLPILFYLILAATPSDRRLLSGTVWGLFSLSTCSFIFFGLKALVI